MEQLLYQSLKKLHLWIKQNGYSGWDPYDGISNPKISNIKIFYPYLHIFLIQLNKHSPVNIRPLLNIPKGTDTKGLALFLQSYSQLYIITRNIEFQKIANELYQMIIERSLFDNYGYHCWASHYYPYVDIEKNKLLPELPDIIGTSNVIKGLSLYYKILGNKEIRDVLKSSLEFLQILIKRKGQYTYFLYTPKDQNIVPNASAEALEAIYYASEIVKDFFLNDATLESVVKTILQLQDSSGYWLYSISLGGKVRKQLDFHQGYIIDGLIGSLKLMSNRNLKRHMLDSIIKGIIAYKKMFTHDGRAYYRYPRMHPIDIHNQAQGIITFSKSYTFLGNREYLKFAEKIALWTIKNMQDKRGFFYYQRWPFFVNKIPYMRWGQAWMLLALVTLLKNMGGSLDG